MLHSDGFITYSKIRNRIEWIDTPDGRRIENPWHFKTSRLVVPEYALLWGFVLAAAVAGLSIYAYRTESEKAAKWRKAEAIVMSFSQSESQSKDGRRRTQYRPLLRFSANAGSSIDFTGPPQDHPPQTGSRQAVYYDPQDPAKHATNAPNPTAAGVLGSVFAVLFLVLGIAGQVHGPINRKIIEINDSRWTWLDGKLVEGPR